MPGQIIGQVILWIIIAVVVITVVVWLLNWLYHRSTKDTSFVRTGLGGEKVVINGGAFYLPVIHEITPVSMNVHRLHVLRAEDTALMSRDRIKVDVDADFFVRVAPTKEGVSRAAATLGPYLGNEETLAGLLESKFVSVLRVVAGEMDMDAMHENRDRYIAVVSERVSALLAENGLELEGVAISDLDQSALEYFNPANRFDSEGLTNLIQTIEERRKLRNDIEQSSMVEIRSRNLQAEQQTLEIERESTQAKLAQEREIEELRAAQSAEVARVQAERAAEASAAKIASDETTRSAEIAQRRSLEEAEIQARQEVEQKRIAQERNVELARIERERAVRETEISERAAVEAAEVASEQELQAKRIEAEEATAAREIERAQKLEAANIASKKELETARIAQELANEKASIDREKALKAVRISEQQATAEAEIASREEIERARLATDRSLEEARILLDRDTKRLEVERALVLELAEIEKDVEVLKKRAEESAQSKATSEAEAEAAIAAEAVETSRETEVARRIAAIDMLMAEKDADAAKIAAETDKIRAAVKSEAERLMNEADNMLSEEARAGRLRAKVLERLEGIIRESVKPIENIDGIKIVQMGGMEAGGMGGSKSPTDEVIESALRYRAQAPLIDEVLKEIGVPGANVAKMGDIFRSAKDAHSLGQAAAKDDKKDD